MNKEAKRWLRQADADIKAANDSLKDANYEWSCFQSQQGGEKALKAYLYSYGYTSLTTHSLRMLIKEAEKKEGAFSALEEAGAFLDAYYIPTRYPNGLDREIAPVDYYKKEDADRCLNCATSISKTVKKYIKK